MDDNRKEVVWSPRVSKAKLRQLYERSCQGIWDEVRIDDVGMDLPEALKENDQAWHAKQDSIRWDEILERKRNAKSTNRVNLTKGSARGVSASKSKSKSVSEPGSKSTPIPTPIPKMPEPKTDSHPRTKNEERRTIFRSSL